MTTDKITNDLTLEYDQLQVIIDALLIGLDSFGEIERLDNAVDILEVSKIEVPELLRPKHPTGAADTVGVFATALRLLQQH